MNVEVGAELKEVETVADAGDGVSEGWTTSLEVEEVIELVGGVFVIVGCRLMVPTELTSAEEDDA